MKDHDRWCKTQLFCCCSQLCFIVKGHVGQRGTIQTISIDWDKQTNKVIIMSHLYSNFFRRRLSPIHKKPPPPLKLYSDFFLFGLLVARVNRALIAKHFWFVCPSCDVCLVSQHALICWRLFLIYFSCLLKFPKY